MLANKRYSGLLIALARQAPGRAAYLGEQSCGYLDPGIESSRVMIASLHQAFEHLSAA
ncbi:hypothetical protein ACT691_20415 [Vibrio metschnikovii]